MSVVRRGGTKYPPEGTKYQLILLSTPVSRGPKLSVLFFIPMDGRYVTRGTRRFAHVSRMFHACFAVFRKIR